MENRAGPLSRAGSYGLRTAWMALTGEDPDLVSAPRAYSPTAAGSASSSRYCLSRQSATAAGDAQPLEIL